MTDLKMHIVLPSRNGIMGLTLTGEQMAIVNRMQEENPGKYEGVEGTIQALVDYEEKYE